MGQGDTRDDDGERQAGMRILITGCNGQLGRDCQDELGGAGHVLLAKDLPELDIADEAGLGALMRDWRPELVVNCAAYTAVDRAEREPEAAERANATGPGVLAKACAEIGSRLIHVSTDYVFPGTRPPPEAYVETDATGPRSVYGRTKLAGEQAVLAALPGRAAILRTAWLYGAKGRNFLKAVLTRALSGQPLKVVADQHGSPTCSESLARQIRVVAEAGASGLFHATSLGHCTWYEFAVAFFREMGVEAQVSPCSTAEFPADAPRPLNSILDNAALRAAGLDVMPRWEDALSAFVARHRSALIAECQPKQ